MAEVTTLTRTFHYGSMELPDPNPALSVREAQDLLSSQYPELANAKTHVETSPASGRTRITFSVAAGTKG